MLLVDQTSGIPNWALTHPPAADRVARVQEAVAAARTTLGFGDERCRPSSATSTAWCSETAARRASSEATNSCTRSSDLPSLSFRMGRGQRRRAGDGPRRAMRANGHGARRGRRLRHRADDARPAHGPGRLDGSRAEIGRRSTASKPTWPPTTAWSATQPRDCAPRTCGRAIKRTWWPAWPTAQFGGAATIFTSAIRSFRALSRAEADGYSRAEWTST